MTPGSFVCISDDSDDEVCVIQTAHVEPPSKRRRHERRRPQQSPAAYIDGTLPDDIVEITLLQDDLVEIFSPPRLVAMAQRTGLLRAQLSVDLETGWDLSTFGDRSRVMHELQRRRPRALVTSAPCTWFSALMRLWNLKRMSTDQRRRAAQLAEELFDFGLMLFRWNILQGRKSLHEHPRGASSWKRERSQRLIRTPGIYLSVFDQCRFGLTAPVSRRPMRKRTQFMSNIGAIHSRFHRALCSGRHVHCTVQGSEGPWRMSSWAQRYPEMMVLEMVKAIHAELQ